MASKTSKASEQSIVKDWLDEDKLMLLECWARDGYTYGDIANKIGISTDTLSHWRKTYPEIAEALKKGKEVVDYMVENALLKSALGYRTKEVKVITTIRFGKVVETVKEVTEKDQAPNVSAAQCWLYNRLPNKWKNMNSRANILEDIDKDTSIQVVVTRATKGQDNDTKIESAENKEDEDEWNNSITLRKSTDEEIKEAKKKQKAEKAAQKAQSNPNAKAFVEQEQEDEDLDEWPEDWEEEEGWDD